MEGFSDVASGARGLRVNLNRGDITIRVVETGGWTLEASPGEDAGPEMTRDGDVVYVRHQSGWSMGRRQDIRITLPPGVESVELRTGMGKIDAEGVRGHLRLDSGSGALLLRAAGGEATAHTGNGAIDVIEFRGSVEAASGNGKIRVEHLQGEATLRSGNGRIEVVDSAGRSKLSTGNGPIVLTRSGGEAEVDSGHGSIEVTEARDLTLRGTTGMGTINVDSGTVRELRLKSMMGAVHCAAALAPGRYVLESGMGAIALELPATARARLEAQTGFGNVHSDFPLVRVGRTGPMSFGGVRMVGNTGDGEPDIEVSLRSGKGDITLRRTPGASGVSAPPRPAAFEAPSPPTPPAAPAPPRPGEPAKSPSLVILESLARGDITPSEAEDLLSRSR